MTRTYTWRTTLQYRNQTVLAEWHGGRQPRLISLLQDTFQILSVRNGSRTGLIYAIK